MTSFSDILTLLLYLGAAGLGIATLLGFLGRTWWVFELFSHFRVQYAALAVICAAALLLTGQPLGFWLCLGIYLLNLVLLLPLYLRTSRTAQPGANYRILTANILGHNGLYGPITLMLQGADADLALLVEYRHHHHQALHAIRQTYPEGHFLPRSDNYGLALLSRLPFLSAEITCLNEDQVPVLVARLELEGRPLTIIGSHPPPPKSQAMTDMRDRHILALARFAAEQPGEAILLGDFNTTPWSYAFSDLRRESKLRHSQSGFGLQTTWPDHLPPLRIPIDHILHSPGLRVTRHRTGPFSGSDHRPVIVDFCLNHDPHP